MRTSFIFALVCIANLFAAWDGLSTKQPKTTPINGQSYYKIKSAEELAWFAEKVNSGDSAINAVLDSNINLNMNNWIPIGNGEKKSQLASATAFSGIFDGANHTISGINVATHKYAGLFGIIRAGTVKNLVIEDSPVNGHCEKNDYSAIYECWLGTIAGYVDFKGVIKDVINRSSIAEPSVKYSTSTQLYIGGIAGASNGTISNCTNDAPISITNNTLETYIGGIVGYVESSGTLDNLYNEAAIEGPANIGIVQKNEVKQAAYVGGIAGYCNGNTKNLNNNGFVSGGYSTGGIFGATNRTTSSFAINNGNVSGNRNVGGICGICAIKNATNKGNIIVSNSNADSLFAGGICGKNCTIHNSQNLGNIEIYIEASAPITYAGGISGWTGGINTSLNFGNVTVNSNSYIYAGGITGSGTQKSGYGIKESGNHGKITGFSTQRTAYIGGLTSKITNGTISNSYNQGKIQSSHYAAGIASFQDTSSIKNVYVATDSIIAPNAAIFVNYHHSYYNRELKFEDSLTNIYYDKSLLAEIPLIGENSNSNAMRNIVGNYTKAMQSDSFSFVLNQNSLNDYNSRCWSRDSLYPIIADSIHQPILKVPFITYKNDSCFNRECQVDTLARYTNYKGVISSFPELDSSKKWFLFKIKNYSNTQVLFKDRYISDEYKFDNNTNFVVALYDNCNESAASKQICCLSHIINFYKEYSYAQYGSKAESTYSGTNYDSAFVSFCQDDDENGLLNWADSNSSQYSSFQNMKSYIESRQPKSSSNTISTSSSSAAEKSSSSIKESSSSTTLSSVSFTSSSSVTKSSSSNKPDSFSSAKVVNSSNSEKSSSSSKKSETIFETHTPQFSAHVVAKNIQISGAKIGSTYALFDMQGKVLLQGLTQTSNFSLSITRSGIYLLQIGTSTQKISIK